MKEDSLDLARGLLRQLCSGGVESEATRVTEFVQGYILENRPCFDVEGKASNVVALAPGPRNFLGFYRGDYIYVLPAALNKAITSAGFNYGSAMDLLVREGILERGKGQYAKVVRFNGDAMRMLKFEKAKLFQEQPKSSEAASSTTEQMTLDEDMLVLQA